MEFTHEVKELQRQSHECEAKIAAVKIAKHQILDDIVEVERQVLLWGNKIKLEKETQAALNSSDYANETKGMEKEIHRMKHRLDCIKREQERMIREMELSIHKREDIAVKYHNARHGQRMNSGSILMSTSELKKKKIYLRKELNETGVEVSKVRNYTTWDMYKCSILHLTKSLRGCIFCLWFHRSIIVRMK